MDILFGLFGGFALVLLPVMAVRAIDESDGQSRSWVFAWGLIGLLATFCSLWLFFSSLLAGVVGIILAIIYLRTAGRQARPDFVVEEPLLNQADSEALADELKRLEAERDQGKRL
jgi:hypothetical protein